MRPHVSTRLRRAVFTVLFNALPGVAPDLHAAPRLHASSPDAVLPPATQNGWSCTMFPVLGDSEGGFELFATTPPLSRRQTAFTEWFNQAALEANPLLARITVPIYTLRGANNALANPRGIFVNPSWFARIGDVPSTGVLAHELAHIAQFFDLVDAAPPRGTQFEGQADYVSGVMLRRSGLFSEREARDYAAFLRRSSGAGSRTHPSGGDREKMFFLGWASAR